MAGVLTEDIEAAPSVLLYAACRMDVIIACHTQEVEADRLQHAKPLAFGTPLLGQKFMCSHMIEVTLCCPAAGRLWRSGRRL